MAHATEAQEQMVLIKRAHYHPIAKDYLFAIPNGGSRHPKEAVNLKLQGVKSGVSDLCLAYPVPPYHGFFGELKRLNPTKGKVSVEQQEFLDRMGAVGYATCVAYGADEMWSAMMQYLDGNFEQRGSYAVKSTSK